MCRSVLLYLVLEERSLLGVGTLLFSDRVIPYPASVVFYFIVFVQVVLSKVACTPTAPASKLAVVSSFGWGGSALPEYPGIRILEFDLTHACLL
jgi:hypothetical protein